MLAPGFFTCTKNTPATFCSLEPCVHVFSDFDAFCTCEVLLFEALCCTANMNSRLLCLVLSFPALVDALETSRTSMPDQHEWFESAHKVKECLHSLHLEDLVCKVRLTSESSLPKSCHDVFSLKKHCCNGLLTRACEAARYA